MDAEPANVVRLRAGEAQVEVVPGLGANVVRWRVGDWEVLAGPPDLAALRARPARYGVPVLFPFPNRVRHGRYTWQGQSYQLEPLSSEGHANHGFALREAWDVVETAPDRVVCRLDVGARPHLLRMYPFPCIVWLGVRLEPGRLSFAVRVQNTGPEPLPMGFGLHPYMNVPLGPGGARERCVAQVPARSAWDLTDHLPTGEIAPVTGRLDLRVGRPLAMDAYDDVLTDLDGNTASLADPATDRALSIEASRADGFREWVVYAPPDRDVVALEPYTCPPDAINLAARGVASGLIVLPPGGEWRAQVALRASVSGAAPASPVTA